ncbi:EAL domain-containing protein [Citrobacter braakii]|uniref:EAL domain-containing protein n=1 Tax=Citrobacter braakii TaxID=57706 RepID=UPI00295DA12E|nr:EAL domain-containing protein [Citrobacter braakii]
MSDNAKCSDMTKSLSAFVQPIVNACSGLAVGLEVLVRYRLNKPGGCCYLPPAEFLGELSSAEKFNAVTVGLFNVVSAYMHAINSSGLSFITFNIAPPQLNCTDFLSEIVRFKNEMPSNINLILEMVEGYGSHLNENVDQAIRLLSRHNVLFAIDDFGNKSLALSYIKSPNFSLLKLDRTLATVAQENLSFEKAIKSMVTITNQLGVKLVAEGIETEKQLALLQRCGVQHFQGFLYAKPCHITDYFLNEKEMC